MRDKTFYSGAIKCRVFYLALGSGAHRAVSQSLHDVNEFAAVGDSASAWHSAHSDVIKSYLGQLCLGKSDLEAVENVRADRFFKEALGIGQVPSPARLRQRLDKHAKDLLPVMYRR